MSLIYMPVVSVHAFFFFFNSEELQEVRVITVVYETQQLDAVWRFLHISICLTASSGFYRLLGMDAVNGTSGGPA